MSDAVARLAAGTFVFLLAASLALLYITSRGPTGTEVEAEFTDAFGVLEGLEVRMEAAPAGTVDHVELTDRGTALVTMTLFEGVQPPRADASVSVRQQDLLGDTYVALSPGDSDEPLEGPIPPSRSVSAPRFDDILTTFRRPVREALGILLTQTGITLDRRGDDLNEALIRLRPALGALDELMSELDSQNGALRSLIADAEHVTGQAERRSEDLGPAIDALARTLDVTAERTPELDRGLETLPGTLVQARGTLGRFARLTEEAQPFARALSDAAPELEVTGTLLGPFLEDGRVAAKDLGPTLDLAREALEAGEPTLRKLAVAVPELRATVPPLDDLVDALLPAREKLGDAFFGADGYGAGPKAADDVGLGAISVERPASDLDPARRLARVVPVVSCETFGVPIEPGCLRRVLEGSGGASAAAPASRGSRPPGGEPDAEVEAYADGLAGPPPALEGPAAPPLLDLGRDRQGLGGPLERLRDPGNLDRARRGVDRLRNGLSDDRSRQRRGPSPERRRPTLLDFLLGP